MAWQFIVVLALAIPIILFPAAFLWYMNAGGIYGAYKEARKRRASRRRQADRQSDVESLQDTSARNK